MPCNRCTSRNIECSFASAPDETPRQALEREHDKLSRLYRALTDQSDAAALKILRRVRAGEDPDAVLSEETERSGRNEQAEMQLRRRRMYLQSLAQTTAPLEDIADVIIGPARMGGLGSQLPSVHDYVLLRDSIITLNDLLSVSSQAILGELSASSRLPRQITEARHHGPTHWVSASPWTNLVRDDYSISHLISSFMAYPNPYTRCIEEDVFVQAVSLPGILAEYSLCLTRFTTRCGRVRPRYIARRS